MPLKKLFLTCLSLLIFPFSNNYTDIKPSFNNPNFSLEYPIKEKEIEVKIEDEAKENLIPYEEQTKKNNEYLENNTHQIPNFKNKIYLKNNINQSISPLTHSSGKIKPNDSIFYKLDELSLKQLQRIYLISDALKDSVFRDEIGKIIEKDVADKYAEHGGIILFRKNKIYFKTLESYLLREISKNNFYGPPYKEALVSYIGEFHLHAISYNEEKYAHPSSGDSTISSLGVEAYNEVHEFLITPIKKGVFNIDYYGGDKTKGLCIKVFDLGNYPYDTLKIK